MCTNFIGSFDHTVPDIEQRLGIAILGRSPVSRQLEFARERGWAHLRFYETVGDDFARDHDALNDDGTENPAEVVWSRSGDIVRRFWAEEMGVSDPGQDPRGVLDPMPLFAVLDLTPAGRGADFYPKLDYLAG